MCLKQREMINVIVVQLFEGCFTSVCWKLNLYEHVLLLGLFPKHQFMTTKIVRVFFGIEVCCDGVLRLLCEVSGMGSDVRPFDGDQGLSARVGLAAGYTLNVAINGDVASSASV